MKKHIPAIRASIIAETLFKLGEMNYRNGFDTSVLSICCDEINEYDGTGLVLWNAMLCGRSADAFRDYFDDNESLIKRYEELDQIARGPGSFEMPSWGTYGT